MTPVFQNMNHKIMINISVIVFRSDSRGSSESRTCSSFLGDGHGHLREDTYSRTFRSSDVGSRFQFWTRLQCLCSKTCLCFPAWCLRSEGVSSVLLGVSNTEQFLENLGSLRVTHCTSTSRTGRTKSSSGPEFVIRNIDQSQEIMQ
ncbi:hypothetical protein ILYODFUR_029135 [Ilyodon furcidens]|uniref:Uncharacterized protein n=1 Tax=Ilyodon furcidens TaxID=33524 RepID=A0ABV0UZC6_9TELE